MTRLSESAELELAFECAKECANADKCRRVAVAMESFRQTNHSEEVDNGLGVLFFSEPIDEFCPNPDQLFCQDRITAETTA